MKAFSGGADGADQFWMKEAMLRKLPMEFVHFRPEDIALLKPHQLLEVDEAVARTADAINRRIPTEPYTLNLIRRNYLIAKAGDVVFAVGVMQKEHLIRGGTAWACVMAQQMGKEVIFFDQLMGQWWYWRPAQQVWSQLSGHTYLRLSSKPALIGTRQLSLDGMNAIRHIYNISFPDNK